MVPAHTPVRHRSTRAVLPTVVAALAVAAAAAAWLWSGASGRLDGPVRVGYRDSPPFYFVGEAGEPLGLAVDVVRRAAARAGVPLRWVRIQTPVVDALNAGTIDLWATVPVDMPAGFVSEPWLEASYFLLSRADGRVRSIADMEGRPVAISTGAADGRLVRQFLASSPATRIPTLAERLAAVCVGSVAAAFVEGREGQAALLSPPTACAGVALAFTQVPGASVKYGIGARADGRRIAERLRAELGAMSVDGTMVAIHANWSLNTTSEIGLVYALQQARIRNQLWAFGAAGLTLALGMAIWQISRVRQARRLAEAYARQQERYRLLFERNLAGVYRTTLDGRILDGNDAFARMLGCTSREDLLTRQVWDFYPDRATREAILARLRRDRALANHEITVRRVDGRPAVLLVNATLVDGGDGEVAAIEGTAVDITRQRELEVQYQQAQKLESIGRLAGGVAHDFNNALTAINGYADLVLAGLDDSDPNYPMMLEVQRAGRHAESLTRQLLAFSRRQHLEPKTINLSRIVSETYDLLRRIIGEDVELVTLPSPELSNVRADPGQIQQVLMNLAVNARDAMPGGGRLTIATSNAWVTEPADVRNGQPAGWYARLEITDTGEGMDDATQQQAFEPFFTTKERGKGTGLGLSMVYGIVKQSGGYIRLRSAPGSGTTFTIDLPAVAEPATPDDPPPQARVLRGTETVLVVEDQDDVRRLVVEALKRFGYRVHSAQQAEAAVDLCRWEPGPIHLLLTDVVMPGMTGPAVAAACVAMRPQLKVLYMSGYADTALKADLGQDAPSAYLQKPFTPVQLAARVREVLDQA